MSELKKAAILQTCLIGILLVVVLTYHPHLPDRVASHFGLQGQADGWMSRKGFVTFSVVFPIALATLMTAMGGFSSLLLCRTPASMVNVPNKRYWMAPERRAETLAFLSGHMSRFFLWFGTATTGFVVILIGMSLHANTQPEPRMTYALPVVLAFLVLVIGGPIHMTVKIQRKFGNVPADARDDEDAGREPAPRYWFHAKTYGWGWGPPATWEGWLFFLIWMSAAIFGTIRLASTGNMLAWPYLGVMIAVLLAVCLWKGEPPGWRWGDRDSSR